MSSDPHLSRRPGASPESGTSRSGEAQPAHRIRVSVPGRCLVEEERAAFCVTSEVSVGGIGLRTALRTRVGERVQVELRHVGLVRGTIARIESDGFLFAPSGSRAEKVSLAGRFHRLAEEQGCVHAARRHERIRPDHTATLLHQLYGDPSPCEIVDMSLSGIAVLVDAPLEMGEVI